jgi:hypothetical protein
MTRTKRKTKHIPRNGSALAANSRKSGGPMKHRLQPKGGAKNDQPDLLAELDLDEESKPVVSMPVPMNEEQVKQLVKDITPILDDNEEDDDFC